MSAARLGACVLSVALALCACKHEEVTQIVVVVDSDFDGFERVTISVAGFTEEAGSSASLDDSPLPRRLTLVHDGGKLGPLAVEVQAYVPGFTTPALVEHRAGINFQRGRSLMLKVDLLFECIGEMCEQACVAGPTCVTAEEATELTAWDSKYDRLPVQFSTDGGAMVHVMDGGFTPVGPDAGPSDDAGPSLGSDGGDDGGGVAGEGGSGGGSGGEGGGDSGGNGDPDAGPDPLFPFDPSNFDPEILRDEDLMPVVLDCDTATFDSTTLTFTDWCGDEPTSMVVEQSDSTELVVLAMTSLSIEAGATLRLVGERPVALAVLGDAAVFGAIDANGRAAESGGGGLSTCPSGASTGSNAGSDSVAAGGGSGGGFGTAGGRGGAGYAGSVHVSGGAVAGNAELSPLRGGCPGGVGGTGDGAGGAGGGAGGAFQLTVGGELTLSGELLASGGGGQAGADYFDGGGGGGSGGAILIEANGYDIDVGAVIAANGGGGAGGQPTAAGPDSTAGEDGAAATTAALGGLGEASGADGGLGAAQLSVAEDGFNGTVSAISSDGGGGGGGGGGVGRIRISGVASCAPPFVFSPQPSLSCPDCDVDCPAVPEHGCVGAALDATFYFVCAAGVPFEEARSHCSDVGMSLVRVDDDAENDFLSELGLAELWIGATDTADEDDWRWVQGDSAFWSGDWSGDAVDDAFVAWDGIEPGGTGDAAILTASSKGWSDEQEDDDYPYVCELPP